MICNFKRIYNNLIIDLEHCHKNKQYQGMGDIYTEMEKLKYGSLNSSSNHNEVHTYFAQLMDNSYIKLTNEMVYRAGIRVNDILMLKVIYDFEFSKYSILVEKQTDYSGIKFYLPSIKQGIKYKMKFEKDFLICIDDRARARLNVELCDTIQISLCDNMFFLSKYEVPLAYYIPL